ncbi:MAG: hypothetical protein WB460_15115 [Candidatus Acidiferrales bacterium]
MSRIENELVEQDVANSLVEPIGQQQTEGVPPGGGDLLADLSTDRTDWRVEQEDESYFADPVDLLNSAIDDRERDRLRLGDEEFERLERQQPARPEPDVDKFIREEAAHRNAAGPQAYQAPQPGEAAAPEPSPQQIHEGLAGMDAFIEQHQLGDPVAGRQLVFDLAECLPGADLSNYNSEALGKNQTRVAVSAFDTGEQIGWDERAFGSLPGVSRAAAQEYTDDFLRMHNQDPRNWDGRVDPQILANTDYFGSLSIALAIKNNPGVTDPSRLTNTQNAETAYACLHQAFGVDPVPIWQQDPAAFRAAALKLAYAKTRYMLSFMEKREDVRAPLSEGRAAGRRGRQRIPSGLSAGIRGEQAPRFTSNADIFSPGVVAAATTQRL